MINYKVNFNLSGLILFAIYWSYGINASASHPEFGTLGNILLTIYIGALIFITHQQRGKANFNFKIVLSKIELFYIFALSSALIIMKWDYLKSDLVWDQLAHYRSANIIGIKLLPYIDRILSGNLTAEKIIYTINFLLIIFCYLSFKIYLKRVDNYGIVYLLILILMARFIAIYLTGGNGEPYPPFRTFPISMGAVLFGGGAISARLTSLLVFIIFLITLYLIIRKNLKYMGALLYVICILSIDLILQVSIMVEQSIWTFAILTIFLIRIGSEKEVKFEEHLFWMSLISVVSLIRTPIFIVIPLYIIYLYIFSLHSLREKIEILFPVLISLPFYLQLIIFGSNAFYQKGSSFVIPYDNFPLMRLKFALTEGIALDLWLNFLPVLVVCIYIVSPIVFLILRKKILYFIFLLQILMLYQFFSIRVDHWGINRYQIEYLIPFSLLVIYLLVLKFFKNNIPLLNITILILIVLNLYFPKKTLSLESGENIKPVVEQLYNTTEAIKWAVTKYDPNRVVILSVTYGESPFINAGLYWLQISKLMTRRGDFLGSSEFILPNFNILNKLSNENDIDVIILGDCPWDKDAVKSLLITNGWQQVAIFKNKLSNNEIIALENKRFK